METEGKNNSASKTRPCIVCSELISMSAVKCRYCNSYQDWSRHILRWSALIVALIGIMPIWGIAASLYKIAFSSKSANIEAAVIDCNPNRITIAYANSGSIDGIVSKITTNLFIDGQKIKTNYNVLPTTSPSKIIVSPNQPAKLVDYKAYIGETPTIFFTPNNDKSTYLFKIVVTWNDLKNNSKEIILKSECQER